MIVMWWVLGIFFGVIITISVVIGVAEHRDVKGVCAQCGFLKRKLLKACPRCKFEPTSDEDIAKQFMLSSRQHHVGSIFPGQAPSELRRISRRIESGKTYEFDATQLAEVLKNL